MKPPAGRVPLNSGSFSRPSPFTTRRSTASETMIRAWLSIIMSSEDSPGEIRPPPMSACCRGVMSTSAVAV